MNSDAFADLLHDTITIESLLSRDGYDAPTFGPAVTYTGRVSGSNDQLVTESGREQTAMVVVTILGDPPIQPGDRLTLPAGWVPQQPPITHVERYHDESGVHHIRVVCGFKQRQPR